MLSFLVMLCLACDPVLPAGGAPVEQVDVQLVLAVDISRSMDAEEFDLQRAGYVEAIKDPDFLRAVQSGMNGRIALAYFEWAGSPRSETVLGWQIIDGPESAQRFSDELAARPVTGFRGTSISRALSYADTMLDESSIRAGRRVIDISGDGANNAGPPVVPVRDSIIAKGVIINGLPIMVRPSWAAPLDSYYAECVSGGPGSFVLPIKSAGEFKEAIRRKLILEVSGRRPEIVPVQNRRATNCTAGEAQRRFYTDPYLPELDLSR